jgi:hypothetical protein
MIILVVALLVGCARGQTFSRPEPGSLIIGSTTEQEVVAQFGQPATRQTQYSFGKKVVFITYGYHETPLPESVAPERFLRAFFFEGTLVGFRYDSNIETDSTKFDPTQIQGSKKGKDKCEKVIESLGQPSGEFIYPMIKTPGHRKLAYSYSEAVVHGGWKGWAGIRDTYLQRLYVTCDSSDVIIDVDYTESGTPLK